MTDISKPTGTDKRPDLDPEEAAEEHPIADSAARAASDRKGVAKKKTYRNEVDEASAESMDASDPPGNY